MRVTGFRRDDEYSKDGIERGEYTFEDGTPMFGERDPQLDAMLEEQNAPVEHAPTMEPSAVDGSETLQVSSKPTPFATPIDEVPDVPPGPASGSPLGDMNERHRQELESNERELERQQALAKERDIRAAQMQALQDIEAKKAERQRQLDLEKEHSAKLERLDQERKEVESAELHKEATLGEILKMGAAMIAGALGGYIGNDSVQRMYQKDVDDWVNREMAKKNSKLDQLANQLGSEDKARLAARAAAFKAAEEQLEARARLSMSNKEMQNLPLLKATLQQQRLKAVHAFEQKSMADEIGFAQDQEKAQLDRSKLNLDRAEFGHRREIDWARLGMDKAAAAQKAGAKPAERGGLDLNVPIGTEDKSPQIREAYANQFNPGDAKDAGAMKAYSNNQEQIGSLRETIQRLSQEYGVSPDSNGRFPDTSETYASGATGPGLWNNWDFGAFDSKKTRRLKDLWTKVEENTRMQWKAEPNGEVAQQKFQMVAVPKRDADVGVKLNELAETIQRLEEQTGAAAGAHVRAAYRKRTGAPMSSTRGGGISLTPREQER